MSPVIPGLVSTENTDYYWEGTGFPKRDCRFKKKEGNSEFCNSKILIVRMWKISQWEGMRKTKTIPMMD